MNRIAQIIQPQNILVHPVATSKKRVFEQIGLLVERQHHLARLVVYGCLFEREKLGSTGIGHGIAIPHGRIPGLTAPSGIFVKLAKPIPYEAPDSVPVDLLFALLVPEHMNDVHLKLLAELAQLFSQPPLRSALRETDDIQTLHTLLTNGTKYAPDKHRKTV
ncbi:MAG: PTS sugar transporter subunit IIA [Proteobacteria bacterium]|nr:PTS sugar transporter subunit IIA [Pseudomonadota bacterium]MDE3208572.1 PTS sugar transporter subunit IIA [Pseudomonadota bacterium]